MNGKAFLAEGCRMAGIGATVNLALIDDDEGVLRALTMLLRSLGFGVHPFSSARDAVGSILETSPLDIVVTDLRMPGFSGEDVVREIRSQGSRIPIIVMSGHAIHSDIERLRSLGMNAFISKPFTPDAFLNMARSVLATASKRDAA